MFLRMLEYIWGLKFDQAPDYAKVKGMLNGLIKKNGYEMDYKFDW